MLYSHCSEYVSHRSSHTGLAIKCKVKNNIKSPYQVPCTYMLHPPHILMIITAIDTRA